MQLEETRVEIHFRQGSIIIMNYVAQIYNPEAFWIMWCVNLC